ncbi:MAG: PorT family protein [Bacteroidales bacterium]|nr:PorT family protein [Bacteroidales bacterium]
MKIKLYITISVIFLSFFSSTSFGQRIRGAVIAGLNMTQVDGDEKFGFRKFGLNMGAAAIVPFGKNFSFSIETIFNQKGSYEGKYYEDKVTDTAGNVIAILNGQYKLKLDYLEVPVLVSYTDKDIITAGLGFSYGRLVSIKEYEHDTLNITTTLNGGPYNRNDFNVLIDLRFRIYKKLPKLKFNIRYSYSLAKIRTREFENNKGETWTRHQYNNVITFRLIYVFNEKSQVVVKND